MSNPGKADRSANCLLGKGNQYKDGGVNKIEYKLDKPTDSS